MTSHAWIFTALISACAVACADDGGPTTTTDANSDGSDDATATDTGTGMDTDTGTDTDTDPIPCGESECAAGEACLTFPQPPMCELKMDDQPCPEGTVETQCGGAGFPCCCGPTPPTIYECTSTEGCGEMVDCACLSEVCIPACETTLTEGVFICEELPSP